jgi:hypothetical protein
MEQILVSSQYGRILPANAILYVRESPEMRSSFEVGIALYIFIENEVY